MYTKIKNVKRNRRGAAAVMILLLTVLLLIAVCFSLDIARIQLAQLELQSAADLSARAGAEAMARGVGDETDVESVDAAIRDEIDMIARLNRVAGDPVVLDLNSEIRFGSAAPSSTNDRIVLDATADEKVDEITDAVMVTPNLDSFPVVFGAFVGRESVGLGKAAAAMISERDIVIVVDRSTSMRDNRDAGLIPENEYDANLRDLHERLNNGDTFETNGSNLELTRSQALKLALLKFRETIDNSRGREKLGLQAYSVFGDDLDDARKTNSDVDVVGGLSGVVETEMLTPFVPNYASGLESEDENYRNFDFNYISMRNTGSTHIADGIEKGVDILFGPGRRPFARPVLIVMTDGRHNQAGDPAVSAQNACDAHDDLLIFTVSFGAGADTALMDNIAAIGGGEHHSANDVNQLITVFEELANRAGVQLFE